MAKVLGLKKWILPIYHNQVANYDSRFNVFYGGAGSGKSVFVVQKTILKALKSKRTVLVVRKVGNTLKTSIFAEFKKYLEPYARYIVSINKSDMTITLRNGSVILFKGLDDSEKIKSISGITDIVIEEASELLQDDFEQLDLRLRSRQGHDQIHLMFNPVSKVNWVYRYFFEKGTPQDCVIKHTTYKDNPKLPKKYIESLERLKLTNPNYYKIYVLGDFATLDKLVFSHYEKKIINQEEIKDLPFWVGMDFGYVNDPTALTWGRYDKDKKRLYITGEYNKKGMTNDVIAQVIIDLGFRKERVIADSAEAKSIAEIKKLGIPRIKEAEKGQGSVNAGLDRLLRLEIIVDERCVNVIEELENYTWKKDKKTGEYINEPIDEYNHHIDSIRYGVQSVIGKLTNWKF